MWDAWFYKLEARRRLDSTTLHNVSQKRVLDQIHAPTFEDGPHRALRDFSLVQESAAASWPPSMQASPAQYDDNLEGNSEVQSQLESIVADELLRQLERGHGAQRSAKEHFLYLAFRGQQESKTAQHALQIANKQKGMLLASSLRGHVRRASQNKHANYVVAQVVEIMPKGGASFIVEELSGVGCVTACHPFACRVLCRILEHLMPDDQATLELMEEVVVSVKNHNLCSHKYGSYVVRTLLEHGVPEHRHQVAIALLPKVASYAKHRLGSHVVEAALQFCSPEDQYYLAHALLANQQQVVALATNSFGRHVVKALLACEVAKRETEDALRQVEGELKHSKVAKALLQSLPTAAAAA